jgi:hypothetical protein
MLPETPKSWGKAAPETFFGKLIDTFSPNFPNSGGMLAEILAAGEAGIFVRNGFGSGMDLRQDHADALSGARREMRRSGRPYEVVRLALRNRMFPISRILIVP